jgi:acyl-CoA hydrolase
MATAAKESYMHKLITVEKAADLIESDCDIMVAQAASEPQACMAHFHRVQERGVTGVKVFGVLTLNAYKFFLDPSMKGHIKLASWFHSTHAREAIAKGFGTVTFVPNMLHRAATDRLSVRAPRLFYGTCTAPDAHGFVSLSLGITYEKDAIEAADIVVLEINEKLPRTYGDVQLHVDEVDYFVEANYLPPTLPRVEPSEMDLAIGRNIAELVPDGATIQLGIGGIPNAAAMALKGKKNLGVHTEMFVDSMMELYKMGVITNKQKGLVKGKSVATFAMGSHELYDWLHDNVSVEFQRGKWTNDPAVIRQNTKMHSINTCLMVDFTGQVASESIASKQYSGTGGQADTAIGAVEGLDGEGKSIIACQSTARNGTISTITPTLPEGTAVTLHRSNVDHVVTEYGIARLRGRTVEERVQALIKVAHPNFRETLHAKAVELGYL